MPPTSIIGLSGRMGSGKDAVAEILKPLGYRRFAFADALRAEVMRAISCDERLPYDLMPPLAREAVNSAWPMEVYEKPTTPRMRSLLQWWGTEYRRAQCPTYWTDRLREAIAGVDLVVISDVRFADEAALVKELSGEVWRIERPGTVVDSHSTEAMAFGYDRLIINDGTLEDLAVVVRGVVTCQ